MIKDRQILVLLAACFLAGCSAQQPFYNKKEEGWKSSTMPSENPEYTVYLLGEMGEDDKAAAEVLQTLRQHTTGQDTNHTTIIIGEQFYKKKLPDEKSSKRKKAEEAINSTLDYFKEDKGKLMVVAGQNAYMKYKVKDIERTRSYVEKQLGRKGIFYPEVNCPGPEEVEITKNIVAIPLNTQWMLTDEDKRNTDCDVESGQEWIEEVKDIIDNNQRKSILVIGYHPVVNQGNYGGFFSPRQHIFPLTDLNKNLYIPLPVIGSLYPIYRSGIGNRNDVALPAYDNMRRALVKSFDGFNNIIYAAGHEHNLQYAKYRDQDFIVTNSTGDKRWAGKSQRVGFTYSGNGFSKLTYLKNGEIWLEYFVPDKELKAGRLMFRKKIKENPYAAPADSTLTGSFENISDSTIVLAADLSLKASGFRELWLGKHYRDTWTTPVRIPVIDLQKEKGGLEILKKGGGFQTKSLQLKDSSGEEHSLRSVVKYPERLLGHMMTNTLAADFIKDQTSANHPYAATIVDDLSEGAGINHTAPKLVYIPNDRQLAEFRKDFGNTLALFEKRADGDLSKDANLSYATEAISSDKLMKKLKKDNSAVVDDYALLKSRLFDMWINDWDRHEGQWRWGLKECDDATAERCSLIHATKSYYVPIPKDRDQALSKYDGIIPWISTRKWGIRKFQHFDDDIRDVPGINFNARNFDHAFLSELSREEWNKIADELMMELTDERIETSVKQLPAEIYAIDGEEIIRKLKSRRNKLKEYANEYYDFLSLYVDVKGSDEKEYIEVTRINDDSTKIAVYADDKGNKGNLIFDRTVITGETKEVRIYGMDGDDSITLDGDVKKGVTVRIIGGKGKDVITDNSKVRGWCKKTRIYDDETENKITTGSESRDLTSNDEDINDYDYKSYRYNVTAPALFFGFNRDDGVFLGGGIVMKRQGFRKEPYAWKQRIVANVALKEQSFNLKYGGDFIGVFGKWGISADLDVLAPKSNTNFFGLGNETPRLDVDDEYYRLRFDYFSAFAGLLRPIGKHHTFKIGPAYKYIEVENTPGRFIASTDAQPYFKSLEQRHFGGLKAEYTFEHIDDSVLTFRGIKWMISGTTETDMLEQSETSAQFESQLCLYVPFGSRATIAFRAGGATRTGDFDFYQANTLGWQSTKRDNANLRGYLRGRYAGRSVAYFNTDLRVKLWTFKTYLFPAHLGLLGFYDTGRVWLDNEKSDKWHTGYGGGVWFDPFAMTVVNLTYAIGEEEKLFSVSIGFLF